VAANISSVEVFVFYFDVLGFVDQYLSSPTSALNRLRAFQRAAREAFAFGREHSYVVTLYDNVWARFNVTELGTPSLLLDFAGHTMSAAQSHGFPHFFGAITRGIHDFDPNDRMLVGGESFEDLKEQHLDVTSEPHIRAAFAEKWARVNDLPKDCVWVGADVADLEGLEAQAGFPDSAFGPFGETFDLANLSLQNGSGWPFDASRFRAIRPKEQSVA